jgi:heme exporter protein A
VLRAESLTAIRGERLVFQDVSFELRDGGALILSGRNGSG